MKKLYTTTQYKRYHKRKLEQSKRVKKNKKKFIFPSNKRKKTSKIFTNSKTGKSRFEDAIYAPKDFRLIENTDSCLEFFRDIRDSKNVKQGSFDRYVSISLVNVEKIDYAAISSLIAITDDLKSKKIGLQGDLPFNLACKKYISETGFLNHMLNGNGKPFPKYGKSDFIFFEKGSGKLSKEESKKITEMIIDVVEHLTGERKRIKPLKTILLEICANSIEHADTINKQWLLGVKYADDKVYFTVTDVGKGILSTLYITNYEIMKNLFQQKSKLEILRGAFEQKYGSSTQEENRNKGLPAVRTNYESGTIKNLIVLTNNVILHFDDNEKSSTFSKGATRFRGTLYQWELTKECIINSINCYE